MKHEIIRRNRTIQKQMKNAACCFWWSIHQMQHKTRILASQQSFNYIVCPLDGAKMNTFLLGLSQGVSRVKEDSGE